VKNNQVCARCILDTTVPEIIFDAQGVCQYCKIYDELDRQFPLDEFSSSRLIELISKIKLAGKGKKYDCIVGVSGGTDSTYTLWKAVQLGLRPLAVHFDNGWNTQVAVKNIRRICEKLKVDLFTYVVNWEEFKDIQISFLKASTPDVEIPTDVGILSTLFKTAKVEGVKYILYGHSFRAEGVAPIGWSYYDGRYIRAVQNKFGTKKIVTYPNFTLTNFIFYNFLSGIKMIPILNYFHYSKSETKELLEKELAWEDSGGHHHESTYTHFSHSYLLPKKFSIDKRKVELSAKVLSKQMSRSEALSVISEEYPYHQNIVDYTISKLGLSKGDFEVIMKNGPKSFKDYPSYLTLIKIFRIPFKWAYQLKVIPELLYLKYRNAL
jgi:N-acetyl sugar amidotransferase